MQTIPDKIRWNIASLKDYFILCVKNDKSMLTICILCDMCNRKASYIMLFICCKCIVAFAQRNTKLGTFVSIPLNILFTAEKPQATNIFI